MNSLSAFGLNATTGFAVDPSERRSFETFINEMNRWCEQKERKVKTVKAMEESNVLKPCTHRPSLSKGSKQLATARPAHVEERLLDAGRKKDQKAQHVRKLLTGNFKPATNQRRPVSLDLRTVGGLDGAPRPAEERISCALKKKLTDAKPRLLDAHHRHKAIADARKKIQREQAERKRRRETSPA